MGDSKNFKTILLPNASQLQRDLERIFAKRIAALGAPNRAVTDPDQCPAHVLPWLAWEMSVDVWNEDWAEEIRREVIKASLHVHKRKGTIGSLKRALSALNLNLRVEEWFSYGGDPYTFRVFIEVSTAGFDIMKMDEVMAVIIASKNARSHLESLRAFLTTRTETPTIGAAFISGEVTTIYPQEI
ncbi:MAG: phage tail protein I [Alphaproteobacteria bacterium]